MPTPTCPSCASDLQEDFRFCPYCGRDLLKPLLCPNCGFENESNSRFCQECGTPLRVSPTVPPSPAKATRTKPDVATPELEPPPQAGITIEFPYSSSQSFDFAVKAAAGFPSFHQYGQEKKAIYRVTLQPAELDSALDLLENMKGWRRRTVYVDGEKVTWDSVFSYEWCYRRKKASFKPEFYCFGYDNEYEFNVWGCIQSHLPFTENAEWFTWGQWMNNKGDWKFDKERIRHSLQKALYTYRFCPALQPELVEDVLAAISDVVNPSRDKNWKFVEEWGEGTTPGLVVTVDRFGIKQKVTMKGVAPVGQGALKELAKRMKHRLPDTI